jgi:hypothetical protein
MSIHFPDQLILLPFGDGVNFAIGQNFRYIANDGSVITVPAGFICDLASVPKMFWNIYDRWGVYGPAAVIHDYLYWTQTTTKARADELLLEAMVNLNTGKLTRFNIYHAVDMFGGWAWSNNAKQDKSTGFIVPIGRMTIPQIVIPIAA